MPQTDSPGLSESTPKRSLALFSSESAKTPNDKPVVLDEEFSPIELFPFSQSQSVPIVQWNYNAAQRTTRNCEYDDTQTWGRRKRTTHSLDLDF
jgi:hypothetical protein